ncbi:PREDICTED: uncharacterized protein LOC109391016 isoform X1 [Hipposideros armiger]|uniref:Uncharacterized protein LOC109391016 isoform X1 n=1 Tax=Hipposideros armiger TaxID=186990 RepID=A0A8B7SMU1_HIPAR|nr:PREDICTED: uncharacterized protein LOC109391016 isoform X1 [Hipposideros armiger]XP_019513724.1 PREDICTED: uncharacterized protein LOC109391016 isoform X1 [Hipposideros armiger]
MYLYPNRTRYSLQMGAVMSRTESEVKKTSPTLFDETLNKDLSSFRKDMSPKAIGNQAADQAARKAALRPVRLIDIMTTQLLEYLPDNPTYTEEERQSFLSQQARLLPDGWYRTPDSRLCLPKALGRQLLAQFHQLTHLGARKQGELVRSKFRIPDLTAITQDITLRCLACAKVSASPHPRQFGTRFYRRHPGEHWEIDFTESLQALQTLQTELHRIIQAAQPDRGPLQPHLFLPRVTVLARRIPSKTLEPTWKGPYIVTLTKLPGSPPGFTTRKSSLPRRIPKRDGRFSASPATKR